MRASRPNSPQRRRQTERAGERRDRPAQRDPLAVAELGLALLPPDLEPALRLQPRDGPGLELTAQRRVVGQAEDEARPGRIAPVPAGVAFRAAAGVEQGTEAGTDGPIHGPAALEQRPPARRVGLRGA